MNFYRILTLVTSILIFFYSNAQEESSISNVSLNNYKELTWFNCDNPKQYLSQDDVLYLIVHWNSQQIDAAKAAYHVNRAAQKNPGLKVVFLYHVPQDDEKKYAHYKTHLLQNNIQVPAAIVFDKNIIKKTGVKEYPSAVLYSTQHGVIQTYEGIDAFDSIDLDYLGILEDSRFSGLKTTTELSHKLIDDYPEPLLAHFAYITPVEKRDWFFLSQPTKNNLILADVQGNVLKVLGSGNPGITTGSFGYIQFNNPRGMYWDEVSQSLFVADTYNHCLRKVDFNIMEVSSLLKDDAVQSYPTDIFHHKDKLYITMYGLGEVWTLDLETMETQKLIDDKGKPLKFDKPVSIALSVEGEKYIVEQTSGKILVLTPDLKRSYIELSSPVSQVYWHNGYLFAISTYDDVIYVLNNRKVMETIGGKSGFGDGKFENVRFLEPMDIAYMNGLYYVVDAGNNAIRTLNLKSKRVSTLDFKNMGELCQRVEFSKEINELDEIKLAPGHNQIIVKIDEPDGYRIDYKFGINQILPGDFPSNARFEELDLNDDVAILTIEGEEAQGVIEIMVALTYYSDDIPRKFYQKMERYFLPVVMDPNAESNHEVIIPVID